MAKKNTVWLVVEENLEEISEAIASAYPTEMDAYRGAMAIAIDYMMERPASYWKDTVDSLKRGEIVRAYNDFRDTLSNYGVQFRLEVHEVTPEKGPSVASLKKWADEIQLG